MKRNPLNKRLKHDLRRNAGRYFSIFALFFLSISMVSGFLVAANSIKISYDDSYESNMVEDGRFETAFELNKETRDQIIELGVNIYDNHYIKTEVLNGENLLIYSNRTEVDLVNILEGDLPKESNEIAIDRLYADNNNLSVGDTFVVDGIDMSICGLVALSDYSALFQSNTDLMFDAHNMGVSVVTEDTFSNFNTSKVKYNYSFRFNDRTLKEESKRDVSTEISCILARNTKLTNYLLAIDNQSITFARDDFGKDIPMFKVLLYIIIAIMAFVFSIIVSSTIEAESATIGTLLSNGYTKQELVRHYIRMPMLITFISAFLGNVLGYSVIKGIFAGMYYHSYCLPKYHTIWNWDAFISTTVIPVCLMFLINFIVLTHKLSISPLRFLRKDLKHRRKAKPIRLPHISFIGRFRLRLLIQNRSNYVILFIGIFMASFLLLFGLILKPTINHYKAEVTDTQICDYQYVLKMPFELEVGDAESYTVYSMKTYCDLTKGNIGVTFYGMKENSKYLDQLPITTKEKGIYISEGLAKKADLSIGETVAFQDGYTKKEYRLTVIGTYDYPATLAVFMSQKQLNELIGKEESYYNGYFSDGKLDIDDSYISSVITLSELTKMCDQLNDSMGKSMSMITGVSVILYIVVMYLLTKIVIDKNTISISFMKVFGYEEREIRKIYIRGTTITVLLSLILCLPIEYYGMKAAFRWAFSKMEGYFEMYLPIHIYVTIVLTGMLSYLMINFLHIRRVNRIEMGLALKNRE